MTKTRVGIYSDTATSGAAWSWPAGRTTTWSWWRCYAPRPGDGETTDGRACRCSLLTKWHRIGTISTCSSYAAAARTTCRSRRQCANLFNVVDLFDTHANIPAHFRQGGCRCAESGNVAVILGGLGSRHVLHRSSVRFQRCCPRGEGLYRSGPRRLAGSQRRHSSHRGRGRCAPVHGARRPSALEAVRNGEKPQLTTRQKHTRAECSSWPRRCRPGGYREGHRRDAEPFRRL